MCPQTADRCGVPKPRASDRDATCPGPGWPRSPPEPVSPSPDIQARRLHGSTPCLRSGYSRGAPAGFCTAYGASREPAMCETLTGPERRPGSLSSEDTGPQASGLISAAKLLLSVHLHPPPQKAASALAPRPGPAPAGRGRRGGGGPSQAASPTPFLPRPSHVNAAPPAAEAAHFPPALCSVKDRL